MVNSILQRSQLRLVLEHDVDEMTGESKTKLKSFNNVSAEATSDQLYAVGTALASLQEFPLMAIERADNAELVEVEEE